MSRESSLTGFILKKQPLGEADVLVTWYTKERGKVRTLAVSANKFSSRIGPNLQYGSEILLRTAQGSGSLPKLIGAQTEQQYLKELSEERGVLFGWLCEIILRATPDDEPNDELYEVLRDSLKTLGQTEFDSGQVHSFSSAVLIHVLSALGSDVHETPNPKFFSNHTGGFTETVQSNDSKPVTPELFQRFEKLSGNNIETSTQSTASVDAQLYDLLHSFFEYQQERQVRSKNVMDVIIKQDMNSEIH